MEPSSKNIQNVSVKQLKAARALLGWTSAELAAAAGLSAIAVRRLEAREGILGGRRSTADKLRQALEAAGVEFTNGDQPGVRLKARPSGPSSIPPEELNASNDE
jgi:transcriptional regulator with XRE-family HTH domain